MFSEPNINTSPLLEKGAKGKTKQDFEKNHCGYPCTILLLIPHTKYKTEQHNKDRGGYFTLSLLFHTVSTGTCMYIYICTLLFF